MPASLIQIFNRALSKVGTRDSLSNPSENSREAEICRLWYPGVRDQVLASAPWPEGRMSARLAVLAERNFALDWQATDPEPDFRFAYSVPTEMLQPRYLSTFQRFTLSLFNQNTRAIMTNVENAILIYTGRMEDSMIWSEPLTMAIIYTLAANITEPLSGKRAKAERNLEEANRLVWAAREAEANTEQNTYDTVPDWISARGYALSGPQTRFYFPNAPFLSFMESPGAA